jgi:hypothetical protein
VRKVYYIKQGDEYVPVEEYDPDLMDALPYGTHLTVVRHGGQSRRYNVDPAVAPFAAAILALENMLADIIRQAAYAQPANRPITEEQRKAWEQFRETMGDELGMITYPSISDVARQILETIQAEAEKQLTNPAVCQAYDDYVLLATLSKKAAE